MHPFFSNYFRFIKGILPGARPGSCIGIDMGSVSVKAVELARRSAGWEILHCEEAPWEGADQKDVLGKLLDAFRVNKTSRPVLTGVSGRGTLIRYLDMPRMPQHDLQKVFLIDADRYLPFPKDSVYIDSMILDPQGKDKKMTVLVAAVKKEIIDARVKLLKECGLSADVVTLGPLAMANAFSVFPPLLSSSENVITAVVDIGEEVSNLMIMDGGMPRFNRDIFIGVEEILKRLGHLAGVEGAQGRALLGSPGNQAEIVQRAVGTVMAHLIGEIRLSFDYFVTEKNMRISRIVLVGEGALLGGVAKVFEDSFEIPLAVWDPFENLSAASGVDKEGLKRSGARLVTALGLALNEYD